MMTVGEKTGAERGEKEEEENGIDREFRDDLAQDIFSCTVRGGLIRTPKQILNVSHTVRVIPLRFF